MKTTLKKTIVHDVEIELSGEDLAYLFGQLDSVAQAEFFNTIGGFDWLATQLGFVNGCGHLNNAGRYAMTTIGEYSTP